MTITASLSKNVYNNDPYFDADIYVKNELTGEEWIVQQTYSAEDKRFFDDKSVYVRYASGPHDDFDDAEYVPDEVWEAARALFPEAQQKITEYLEQTEGWPTCTSS